MNGAAAIAFLIVITSGGGIGVDNQHVTEFATHQACVESLGSMRMSVTAAGASMSAYCAPRPRRLFAALTITVAFPEEGHDRS